MLSCRRRTRGSRCCDSMAQLSQQQINLFHLRDRQARSRRRAYSLARIGTARAQQVILTGSKKIRRYTHPSHKINFIADKINLDATDATTMRNLGITLSADYLRWLAEYAEGLGVNIFPGFAATEIMYEGERVCGIITGDKGLDREGKPKASFQPGMELRAKQVIFAEGCRGSLTQTLFARYQLREGVDPQTYGLGIKELWEIPPELHQAGKVMHSIGWPLDHKTYGGSFMYHFGKHLLSIGFVID